MLDSATKRRIDTARDILVGKVPDPKSQVEQITIALIYKFMDDMDAEAEELGGKRKFFTGPCRRTRASADPVRPVAESACHKSGLNIPRRRATGDKRTHDQIERHRRIAGLNFGNPRLTGLHALGEVDLR